MKKEPAIKKVCAVVVTFNRSELLLQCLAGLCNQSRPPDGICIIDNCSQDGTPTKLQQHGYLELWPPENINSPWEFTSTWMPRQPLAGSSLSAGIQIHYIRLPENRGGAGGFEYGTRHVFGLGYDWLWLLDDDGCPEQHTLAELLYPGSAPASSRPAGSTIQPSLSIRAATPIRLTVMQEQHPAVSDTTVRCSLVVSQQDHSRLSFGLWVCHRAYYTIAEIQKLKNDHGIIRGTGNFFNSVLIPKSVFAAIGFPTTDFFIWGDELEYLYRIQKHGFAVVTVVGSRHFHPSASSNFAAWKQYYMVRNSVFLIRRYPAWRYSELPIRTLGKILLTYFLRGRNMRWIWRGFWDGLLGCKGKTVQPQ